MTPSENPAPAGKRILVVDGVPSDRRALADFLDGAGYGSFLARNGADGISQARQLKPDMILLDLDSPASGGIAACRRLKADPETAHIPVILLSAQDCPEDRVLGLSNGAVDFLGKPLYLEELRLRLMIHLRRSQRREARVVADAASAEEEHPTDAVIFKAAQRVVLESLSAKPLLLRLAHSVGTNPRRLNQIFQKYTGKTVFDYLHEVRMLEAGRQLSDTHLDIGTIAEDLGYGSAGNFSTAFRLRFGVTPRAYRKTLQDKPGRAA